eukprot:c18534_g1_i1 orf=317-1885(+)
MENGENYKKSDDIPRVRGSEVFVGGLQNSVTQEMIHEVFSKCGDIVEIRMMTDSNGVLKGYCFVRFKTREAALKAQKDKNGLILQGKKIGVAPSTDQDTLFLGNLKKEWSQEDLESMVRQALQDVQSVELAMPPSTGESPPGKKQQNRGFAFVHFSTHSAAARAFRVANRADFLLGGKWHPAVDWASSEPEPDPEEMSKVKIAFVGNLPNNVNESFLRKLFEPFGKLERVAISRKSNMPVGFVHFEERSDLDAAIKDLDNKVVDGPDKGPKFKLQVSVAKPADKSKKRSHKETQNVDAIKSGGLGMVAVGEYGVGALSGPYAGYTDYAVTKYPRLTTGLHGMPKSQKGPREKVNYENRGSGALASTQSGRNIQLASREAGSLGVGRTSQISVLDSYPVLHATSNSDHLGYGSFGSSSAVGVHPNVSGVLPESLLPIMPSALGDARALPYRAGSGTIGNLGVVGLPSQETRAVERPSFKFDPFTGEPYKFDPFTGEPYKFDPFTGEPLQSTVGLSAQVGRKYY